MTFNYSCYPDPPEDPPEDPKPEDQKVVTCPYCGTEDVLLVQTYDASAGITKEYECCVCDHSWVISLSHDDDDIPF